MARRPRGRPAPPTAPPTREERVRAIMGLMAAGKWRGVRSVASWGMNASAVRRISAEASRRVHAAVEGDPAVLADVRRRLCVLCYLAFEVARERVRAGDAAALSPLAAIARTWGALVGLCPAREPRRAGDDGPAVFRVLLALPEPLPSS